MKKFFATGLALVFSACFAAAAVAAISDAHVVIDTGDPHEMHSLAALDLDPTDLAEPDVASVAGEQPKLFNADHQPAAWRPSSLTPKFSTSLAAMVSSSASTGPSVPIPLRI